MSFPADRVDARRLQSEGHLEELSLKHRTDLKASRKTNHQNQEEKLKHTLNYRHRPRYRHWYHTLLLADANDLHQKASFRSRPWSSRSERGVLVDFVYLEPSEQYLLL